MSLVAGAAVRVVGLGAEEEVAVAAGAVVRAVLGAGVIVAVVRVGITQVALHELDLVWFCVLMTYRAKACGLLAWGARLCTRLAFPACAHVGAYIQSSPYLSP